MARLNFREYSNSIVVERARVGMDVLQNNLDAELDRLSAEHASWAGNSDFTNYLRLGDVRPPHASGALPAAESMRLSWLPASRAASCFKATRARWPRLI
ncbi:MAG: hypothetical protein IJV64_09830 [Oscillospiraceae bacterium]|nr:hypothetical protein [Oscillospiraceae bacterium]